MLMDHQEKGKVPGVPQNVAVFTSLMIPSLHMPKLDERQWSRASMIAVTYSAILICPSRSSRTLSSFRSLKERWIVCDVLAIDGVPIDHASLVQVEETNGDFSRIETNEQCNRKDDR